jgi:hypothetical protein
VIQRLRAGAFWGKILLGFAIFAAARAALAGDSVDYFPPGTFFFSESEILEKQLELGRKPTQEFHNKLPEFNEASDLFQRKWYNKHLTALEEPVLSKCQNSSDVYRVTWLRTFESPMSFRLLIGTDGTSQLIVKRADGRGGFDPGKLDVNKIFSFDSNWTAEMVEGLGSLKVANLPTTKFSLGFDGARWILEVCEQGKYHVVDRQGGGEIMSWALDLMKAPGVELGKVY